MNPLRTFALHRDQDISGISGTGVVALGAQWPDGSVTIRWLGDRPSTVCWASFEDAQAVHGHGGATRFVWDDEPLHEWKCPDCGATTRARMADANPVGTESWGAQYLHSALDRAHGALVHARIFLVGDQSPKQKVQQLEEAIDNAAIALATTWRHDLNRRLRILQRSRSND